MFCTKCGKEIDDGAAFCISCGAPVSKSTAAAGPMPQDVTPQAPAQGAAPLNSAPQYVAPQNGSFPNQAAPVNLSISLDEKMIGIIRKALCGVLALLSIMVIIGAIGSMAVAGTLSNPGKASYSALLSAATNMQGLYYLARVPAIIAFSLSVLGLGFSMFTKQRSLFAYVCACAGVLLFIFNFVLYGGYVSFAKSGLLSSSPKIGGIIVSGIFLIIGSLIMIASSAVVILNKEDIVNYKPKY